MGLPPPVHQFAQNTKDALASALAATRQVLTPPDPPIPNQDHAHISALEDAAELGRSIPADRFCYEPHSFVDRLAVGGRVKSKLSSSKCVRIPYRLWCKFLLIALLILFGTFFTPQLLPKWLGFEWSSTKDLCQNRDEKLENLRLQMDNLTRLPELRNQLDRQQFNSRCMHSSANRFYQRSLNMFQWPDECTPELASADLREEICTPAKTVRTCDSAAKSFFGGIFGLCKTLSVPQKCITVVDSKREEALADLERDQNAQALNDTAAETQPVVETANTRATQLINRLLLQVDIASDIYIAYSIIALIIGMPLIIYKREKGSRVLGATFGMRKFNFIIVVVIVLSMYDSLLLIVRETDFSRLFSNFRQDPCYVDVDFSRQRVNLIVSACNNVTLIGLNSTAALRNMDDTYFTSRRFALCSDSSRPATRHPNEGDINRLRLRYRDGDLKFSGTCNATFLDEQTSTAPSDSGVSKFKALLGSGVLAQLFLKFIFTSWLVHLMAFYEPMIVHNGKVEIWDMASGAKGQSDEELPLNETETKSAVSFASDKHLLPLIILSVLMALELFLIIYSIIVTNTGSRDLLEGSKPDSLPSDFSCPF